MPLVRFNEMPIHRNDPNIEARRMLNRSMGATSISSGISVFAPGAGIFLHTHPCEEAVYIIDGEATCEIDGERLTMGRFDALLVPPRVPHRFWNERDRPFTMLYLYPSVDVTRDPVHPEDQPATTAAHY